VLVGYVIIDVYVMAVVVAKRFFAQFSVIRQVSPHLKFFLLVS